MRISDWSSAVCSSDLHARDDGAYLLHVGDDARPAEDVEQALGDRPGADPGHRLARARPTATARIAPAVLRVVRVVGVPRPVELGDVVVVLALRIDVADEIGRELCWESMGQEGE